jgi:hypothetical protein
MSSLVARENMNVAGQQKRLMQPRDGRKAFSREAGRDRLAGWGLSDQRLAIRKREARDAAGPL